MKLMEGHREKIAVVMTVSSEFRESMDEAVDLAGGSRAALTVDALLHYIPIVLATKRTGQEEKS